MYICICKAITEKDIEKACQKFKSAPEIMKKLSLSSECGSCAKEAFDYINLCLSTHSKVSLKDSGKK